MKKLLICIGCCVCFFIAACSDEDHTYDPYANWPARNAHYFTLKADTARSEIAKAKALYGDDWEQHCEWRMFKSTRKSPMANGVLTDSICVRVLEHGTGNGHPESTDSVWVNYRGTLIPTRMVVNGEIQEEEQIIFSQSFLGDLNPLVAVPSVMLVKETVAGFATALQHMRAGDKWMVYIPSKMAYGPTAEGLVPAYSTLNFFVHLVDYSD